MLEVGDPECFLYFFFAFVADGEFASAHDDVAACAELQRPHVEGSGLQGHPGRDALIGFQGPVVLVGMPWGDAAPGFFVQRLVVVEPGPPGLHEVAGDFCYALAKDEFPYALVFPP